MNGNNLTDIEKRRFREQMDLLGIKEEGLLKLRSSHIAIIGAGGLGAAVLQFLSGAGIGKFSIIDYAIVDESNIQRQSLYGGTDLGKLKTIISKERLRDIFPMSQFDIINLQLTSYNAESVLRPFDILVDATNNRDSSLLIDNACEVIKKPLVYSSVKGGLIQLSVFHYNNGVSFNKSRIPVISECNGASGLIYGIAGAMVSLQVIKILVGLPGVLSGKYITFDGLNYRITETPIS
jgi:sulfur-carrier protein adenylyltransferase/sulfurtransferase